MDTAPFFQGVFATMRGELPPFVPRDDNEANLTYFSDKEFAEIVKTTNPVLSYTSAELAEKPYLKTGSRKLIETEDRIRVLDTCANYFRSLTPGEGIACFEKNNMLPMFQRHLEASIGLLLGGPPGAGKHVINEAKAAEWVAAQKSTKRRELAQKIIAKATYISHNELLTALQDCVDRVAARCDFSRPVVLLTGLPKKSNYYISLLFAHYWLNKKGYPLNYVLEHFGKIDFEKDIFNEMNANILDVDDMAYSGTQTFGLMAQMFEIIKTEAEMKAFDKLNLRSEFPDLCEIKRIIPSGRKAKGLLAGILKGPKPVTNAANASNEPKIEIVKVKNPMGYFDVPRFYIEYLMRVKMRTNYILCRAFCSSQAYALFTNMMLDTGDGQSYILPSTLLFHKRIPSAEELLGKKDMEKAGILFQEVDDVATITYLNHKIADPVSTFLIPLTDGRVPGKLELKGGSVHPKHLTSNIVKANNGVTNIEGPDEYIRFIDGCMDRPWHPVEFNEEKGSYWYSDEKRCPYAWYKSINYNTGKYTPPVLEGGRRRKTRRQRRSRNNTRRKVR